MMKMTPTRVLVSLTLVANLAAPISFAEEQILDELVRDKLDIESIPVVNEGKSVEDKKFEETYYSEENAFEELQSSNANQEMLTEAIGTVTQDRELDVMKNTIVDWGYLESGQWTLYSDGKLELEGVIKPESSQNWAQHELYIKSIEFGQSELLGNFSRFFTSYEHLETVDFGPALFDSVTAMESTFRDLKKLRRVSFEDIQHETSSLINTRALFMGCSSLTEVNLRGLNTSLVKTMSTMFINCSSLTALDLKNFDTSSVTEMNYMFFSCSSLSELDLSGFDTSNVTDMNSMFSGCRSLTNLKLSGFNTKNVKNMSSMFSSCENLTALDLSDFDTSSVIFMNDIFHGCSGLKELNLSNFDTRDTVFTTSMFRDCQNLTLLSLSKNFKFQGSEFLPDLIEGGFWQEENNNSVFSSSADMINYHNETSETNIYRKVKVWQLTMDANGGMFEEFEGEEWIIQEKLTGDHWFELIPTKENCEFDGWYIDQDCTKKFDFTQPVSESLTIYAKWTESYTVIIPATVNINLHQKVTVSGTNNGSKTLKIDLKNSDSQIDDSFKMKMTHKQNAELSVYSQLKWEQHPSNMWNILTIDPESETASKIANIEFSKPTEAQAGNYEAQIVFSIAYE